MSKTVCCLVAHPKSLHFIARFMKHFSAFLTRSHHFVPRLHRTSRPLTGIGSTSCATSLERRLSGHLAESLPHAEKRMRLVCEGCPVRWTGGRGAAAHTRPICSETCSIYRREACSVVEAGTSRSTTRTQVRIQQARRSTPYSSHPSTFRDRSRTVLDRMTSTIYAVPKTSV